MYTYERPPWCCSCTATNRPGCNRSVRHRPRSPWLPPNRVRLSRCTWSDCTWFPHCVYLCMKVKKKTIEHGKVLQKYIAHSQHSLKCKSKSEYKMLTVPSPWSDGTTSPVGSWAPRGFWRNSPDAHFARRWPPPFSSARSCRRCRTCRCRRPGWCRRSGLEGWILIFVYNLMIFFKLYRLFGWIK